MTIEARHVPAEPHLTRSGRNPNPKPAGWRVVIDGVPQHPLFTGPEAERRCLEQVERIRKERLR